MKHVLPMFRKPTGVWKFPLLWVTSFDYWGLSIVVIRIGLGRF